LSGRVAALAVDKSRSKNQRSRATRVPITIPRRADGPHVQTPRPSARAGASAGPSPHVQTARPGCKQRGSASYSHRVHTARPGFRTIVFTQPVPALMFKRLAHAARNEQPPAHASCSHSPSLPQHPTNHAGRFMGSPYFPYRWWSMGPHRKWTAFSLLNKDRPE
jgi:hypothetical protein